MSHIWDEIVPQSDREIHRLGGMSRQAGLGAKPALLVVDVTYEFTGDRPEPREASVRRFPLSCGEPAWQALPRIRELLDAARELGLPVFYTRQAPRPSAALAGVWALKNPRVLEGADAETAVELSAIPDLVAPLPGELVIDKDKPSAFFGTALVSHLVALGVDSLIVAGTTTSGCVRATVVDGFSYNYRIAVAEDGTFDRGDASHKVSLFDMHTRYADVLSVAEIIQSLADAQADERSSALNPGGPR